jgi:hypothetical protein
MAKIPAYLLSLAGEYRVCSELNKRGVFATVTYGHRKAADVYAISGENNRALKIEVKTTQRKKFVTNITRKGLATGPSKPDFWVLVQIQPAKDGTFGERFFVLSHDEICKAQDARHKIYSDKHRKSHGVPYDRAKGIDCVRSDDVKQHADQWSKIVDAIGGPETEICP